MSTLTLVMLRVLDLVVLFLILVFTVAGSVAAVAQQVRRGHLEHTGYTERQAYRDLMRWLKAHLHRG